MSDVEIDLPPIVPRAPLDIPIAVEIHPKSDAYQTTLIEAVGFPQYVPALLNRVKIRPQLRRPLSQWRLDLPLPPDDISSQPDWTVLAVVEKILLRGAITLVSPGIENFINDVFLKENQNDDREGVDSLSRIAFLGATPYHHQVFDSKEEAILYNELLPELALNRNIYAWVIPQLSAAFLSKGMLEPETKQRVDFLVSHPNGS
jgi:hypothetical protein